MDSIRRVPSRRNSVCDPSSASSAQPLPDCTQAQPTVITSTTSACPVVAPIAEPGFTRILNLNLTQAPMATSLNEDTTGLDLPHVGSLRTLTHISTPASVSRDGLQDALRPAFLRRRFVVPKHQVVTEVDRELILEEKDLKETATSSALFKKTQEDDKEEVWNRLNELTTFALVGFGFFDVKIGTGTYNRERKATISRQSAPERDAMWDLGIRVPFGDRICFGAASLTWGTINDTSVGEAVLLLSDFYPLAQETYGKFTIVGQKYESRAKQPTTLEFPLAVLSSMWMYGVFSSGCDAKMKECVIWLL